MRKWADTFQGRRMIFFSCDYCSFESNESVDIKEVNIIQVGASLNGKALPQNEMIKKGENQLCNACYKTFVAWVDSEFKNWVKDNFPLGKQKEDDNSG